MNREQFAHILRAASAITNERVFVVLGSQSALAQFEHLPPAMARSVELDLYPLEHPELAELVEGAIGAESAFHATFGYHADAVGPTTARLPTDWQSRAVRIDVGTTVAICPEIHDLAVSKLLAGRQKDFDWLEAGVAGGLIDVRRVSALVADVEGTDEELALARLRLGRMAGGRV